MSWKKNMLVVMPLLMLCSCTLSTVEDGDYIGMTRVTRTLSFKPVYQEPVRPKRITTRNYYGNQQPERYAPQGIQDCEGVVPASPKNPFPFYAK